MGGLIRRRGIIAAQPHRATASGSSVHLDRAEAAPLSCVVDITAVQSGSGTPSPSNIRPINGWTGANITVTPTQSAGDGTTVSVVFPTEVGTVYGGAFDTVTGLLTVTYGFVDLVGRTWEYNGTRFATRIDDLSFANTRLKGICTNYQTFNGGVADAPDKSLIFSNTGNILYIKDSTYNNVSTFTTAMSGVYIAYLLETAKTYQLDPVSLRTVRGVNNIYADCGNITASFWTL